MIMTEKMMQEILVHYHIPQTIDVTTIPHQLPSFEQIVENLMMQPLLISLQITIFLFGSGKLMEITIQH